jgi:hypothetical protein
MDTAVAPGSRWQVDGEAVTVIAVTGIDAVLVEDVHGNKRSMRLIMESDHALSAVEDFHVSADQLLPAGQGSNCSSARW